jgi:hypothetical protein
LDDGDEAIKATIHQGPDFLRVLFLGQRSEARDISKNDRNNLALIVDVALIVRSGKLRELPPQNSQGWIDYQIAKGGPLGFERGHRGPQSLNFLILAWLRHKTHMCGIETRGSFFINRIAKSRDTIESLDRVFDFWLDRNMHVRRLFFESNLPIGASK